MSVQSRLFVSCPSCQQPAHLKGIFYKCFSCFRDIAQHAPVGRFFRDREMGWLYQYNGKYELLHDETVDFICEEASRALPLGTYFEIRGKLPPNYGRDKHLAWYYSPDFLKPSYLKVQGPVFPPAYDAPSGNFNFGGFHSTGDDVIVKVYNVEGSNDCECNHSWYDHIGFRGHLTGEARLRTSCRIAYCGCDSYKERF